jgi:hypothetical protein
MIQRLSHEEARRWFGGLPVERQIATLSPDYVVADSYREPGLEPVFFGYRESELFWMHGVHRGGVVSLKVMDQQSAYGYGGPVANSNDPAFLSRAWNAYFRRCTEDGILAEFVRLHPLACTWQVYGGVAIDDRLTVYIDLHCPNLRGSYSVRCRNAVRKAEKCGVQPRLESNEMIISQFAKMYRAAMLTIGAKSVYSFSDAYFEALARMPQTRLIVCQVNGDWVSAGLFLTGRRTMEYHLSATSEIGRTLAATNLLIDVAGQMGRAEGLSTLYLGGGTDSLPANPLLFFKSGFSGLNAPFRVAHAIFQPETYSRLKDTWTSDGRSAARVLFYRE